MDYGFKNAGPQKESHSDPELDQLHEENEQLAQIIREQEGMLEALRSKLTRIAAERDDLSRKVGNSDVFQNRLNDLVEEKEHLRTKAARGEEYRIEANRLSIENKKLYEQLMGMHQENQRLSDKIHKNEHVQHATARLQETKEMFKQALSAVLTDLEFLKKIYPMRAFFESKQAEVSRAERTLKSLSPQHPEFRQIQEIFQNQVQERDLIFQKLQEAEQRFQEFTKEVSILAGHHLGEVSKEEFARTAISEQVQMGRDARSSLSESLSLERPSPFESKG